ncbi:MAG: Glutamine--fructose-6-phosphate aminotransferase [isomerizing] [Chlamydiae bacterium]|nr:Glutamine--fructose-6-phosphate aminotransferase [isomerizing] [Chlamydiota bacterium]
MCGIFGYVGNKKAIPIVLEGLKTLEYRGYDSAGVAGISQGKTLFYKDKGKIGHLAKLLEKKRLEVEAAIAHTRWATHGKVNSLNAHPHFDAHETLAIVHNGIIENFQKLKSDLVAQGIAFVSETDSEVIAQLFAFHFQGNLKQTLLKILPLLEGSFAIAGVHRNFPKDIFVACKNSPLAIGVGESEYFVSSDVNGFLKYTNKVIFLENHEIGLIQPSGLKIYNEKGEIVAKQTESITSKIEEISKLHYPHFTLKEIYDQPESINRLFKNRFEEEFGAICLKDMGIDEETFMETSRILILACGTSWHAGSVGAYLFESLSRIPTQVEISSEFRYKNPIVMKDTLVIAISQSGETADTLAAVHELKAKGAKVIAVCNREGSELSRLSDHTLFIQAGPEIGVCSTKAFTNQVVLLSLLALHLGRMHHLSKEEGIHFIREIKKLPGLVSEVLSCADEIHVLAKKYNHFTHFFFIGRSYMYPTSLEAALKLKEMSYIHAQAYPAGELKHGPIALIDSNCPTVALFGNKHTFSKLLSNMMEIKAREGPILAFAPRGFDEVSSIVDDVFWLPDTCDEFASIPTSVALQLFSYYMALERGCDIDQPRNLAKSVTVE